MVPMPDRDKAKLEMGSWMADYFDDAGYSHWETQARIYKRMIMSAFPPLDPLDNVKPDWKDMSVEQVEDNVIKFLAVMDERIASDQRKIGSKLSGGAVMNLFRRR